MDYKKEDNVKTAEVLKEKLNLTRLPVAIKFFNDESEIPEGVEKIGAYAFANLTKVVSVTIPSKITGIGNYSFFLMVSRK